MAAAIVVSRPAIAAAEIQEAAMGDVIYITNRLPVRRQAGVCAPIDIALTSDWLRTVAAPNPIIEAMAALDLEWPDAPNC